MTKISKYNHFHPWHNGHHIAYNARSSALALLTSDNILLLNNLFKKIETGGINDLSPEESQLLERLNIGKFVYDDSRDEIDIIQFKHMRSRYDQTVLNLVIAPTMACNMACEYCYEANKRGVISEKIITAIYQFIEKQAVHLKNVSIDWYGGEPLLSMDKIERITQYVFALGEKYGFDYSSEIVTNGYLLTKDTVDRLIELKVRSAQITLDGPSRWHNKKRPLRNGADSFEKILENIKYASGRMSIAVRVNIDNSFNKAIISEMLDELGEADLQDKIGLYFGMIESNTKACSGIAEKCYNTGEFSQLEVEYYTLLLEKGFKIQYLPIATGYHCIAQTLNSFIVDPEGRLYRCLNYIGDPEKSMGNIGDDINYDHKNFTELFGFNPFEDKLCRNCDILPVCMGGCPVQRNNENISQESICSCWKTNLPQMLDIIALSRLRQTGKILQEKL